MKKHQSFLILSFIPFFFFFLGYGLCTFLFDNKIYKTPDLIGMTLHDAILTTSAIHINLQIVEQKECVGIAPGTIISQKPIASRQIKSHQSIMVTISKTPEKIMTPDFSDLSELMIKKLSKKLKLNVTIHYLPSHMPSGYFIGQFPKAHTAMQQNKIMVYLSKKNTELYICPNFINQPLHQVAQFLDHHDITYQIIKSKPDIDEHEQKIIAQIPKPYATIDLTHSTNFVFHTA